MAGLVRVRQEKKWVHYLIDGSAGTPYAKGILASSKGWLNGDPVIGRDREAVGSGPGDRAGADLRAGDGVAGPPCRGVLSGPTEGRAGSK